jgi:uncharacterized SAM-binding protein YcdF (DUF218 family)
MAIKMILLFLLWLAVGRVFYPQRESFGFQIRSNEGTVERICPEHSVRATPMFYPVSKIFWFVAAPTNLLIIIVLLTIFVAVFRKSRTATWLAVLAASTLAAGSFTPLGFWLMAPLENRFPELSLSSLLPPDGIVVLGGEHGQRITAIVQLSQRFPSARLVYSGAGESFLPPQSEIAKLFLRLGGNPARIIYEDQSRSTYENALYSYRLIKPQSNEHWLLVTSAVHMPRAMGAFRKVGFKVEAYPVDFRSSSELIAGSKALNVLDLAVKEWAGLFAYKLTGKSDQLFPARS